MLPHLKVGCACWVSGHVAGVAPNWKRAHHTLLSLRQAKLWQGDFWLAVLIERCGGALSSEKSSAFVSGKAE